LAPKVPAPPEIKQIPRTTQMLEVINFLEEVIRQCRVLWNHLYLTAISSFAYPESSYMILSLNDIICNIDIAVKLHDEAFDQPEKLRVTIKKLECIISSIMKCWKEFYDFAISMGFRRNCPTQKRLSKTLSSVASAFIALHIT
jgi:c-di-GMP-related signal transduction protein